MCRSSNVRVRLVDDSSCVLGEVYGWVWARGICFFVVVICIMDFLF